MDRRFFRGVFETTSSSTALAVLAGWTVTSDWRLIGVFAGLTAVYTVCKCFGAYPVGDKGSTRWLKDAA